MARGGHGLSTVLLGSAMPYPSMPCGLATPEMASCEVGDLRPSSTPLDTPRRTPMILTLRFIGDNSSGAILKLPEDVLEGNRGVGQHFTADVVGGVLLPHNLDIRAHKLRGELDVEGGVGARGHGDCWGGGTRGEGGAGGEAGGKKCTMIL
jgi:hypothetical protein